MRTLRRRPLAGLHVRGIFFLLAACRDSVYNTYMKISKISTFFAAALCLTLCLQTVWGETPAERAARLLENVKKFENGDVVIQKYRLNLGAKDGVFQWTTSFIYYIFGESLPEKFEKLLNESGNLDFRKTREYDKKIPVWIKRNTDAVATFTPKFNPGKARESILSGMPVLVRIQMDEKALMGCRGRMAERERNFAEYKKSLREYVKLNQNGIDGACLKGVNLETGEFHLDSFGKYWFTERELKGAVSGMWVVELPDVK